MASATDPRGQQTTYTYTAQGLPLTVTSPADGAGVQPSTPFGYTCCCALKIDQILEVMRAEN